MLVTESAGRAEAAERVAGDRQLTAERLHHAIATTREDIDRLQSEELRRAFPAPAEGLAV